MLIKQPTLAVERKEEKREEGYKGLHIQWTYYSRTNYYAHTHIHAHAHTLVHCTSSGCNSRRKVSEMDLLSLAS